MRVPAILTVLACVGTALAKDFYLGFNSGATTDGKKAKKQADFEKEFQAAQKLQGSPGVFSSIRLYTNIQAETKDTPIEAFPAAVKTNTKLLLGIWASGTNNIDAELNALTKAINQYGKSFTDLVLGLSVGSEDMYRVSEPGIKNKAGLGQDAKMVIGFLKSARERLKNTALSSIPIGHVDTWSAWVNESNKDVFNEVDFVGTNLFPYYEDDKGNDISNATTLFQDALNKTQKAAGQKEVWVTETGWPSTGPDFGLAKATLDNAKSYWDAVGCTSFNKRNVWWYTLQDANPDNKAKFAITDNLSTTAKFNLTCPAGSGAPTPTPVTTTTSSPKPSTGSASSVAMPNAFTFALSFALGLGAWMA